MSDPGRDALRRWAEAEAKREGPGGRLRKELDEIEADQAAWDSYVRTHNTWAMVRMLWRRDRSFAALTVALVAVVTAAVVVMALSVWP